MEQSVRAALGDILGWPDVARSPQLARFLTYIVEARLEGRATGIKAYAIAVDVFGRDADFDPQSDPIVRVQARRLRTLLDRYYAEGHNRSNIRISLPVGRYVPEFEMLEEAATAPEAIAAPEAAEAAPEPAPETKAKPAAPASGSGRGGRLLAIGFFIAAALGLVYLFATWAQVPPLTGDAEVPRMPKVAVTEFQNLADTDGKRKSIVDGLALELVTDLGLFEDIDASYTTGKGAPPPGPGDETLSGVARVTDGTVQYGVILTRSDDQSVAWSHTVSLPLAEVSTPDAMDRVSRQLALVLGSQRGPLHREARDWVRQHEAAAAPASPYLCRVLFDLYRDSGSAADAQAAGKCLDGLGEDGEAAGLVLAARAALTAEFGGDLADADALADRAVTAAPTSSFVWEQAARVDELRGAREEARAAYSSALQLNPANSDALAAFGRMLAMGPDWQDGAEMAATAVAAAPSPPAWYFAGPALNSLRAAHFADAAHFAEKLVGADRALGPVLAVVAAAHDGNGDMVNRYLPQVLDYQPFRQAGILVQLRRRLSDPALVANIGAGLTQAGVPEKALEAAY
jgi:Tfp pilus assembly protein PilF